VGRIQQNRWETEDGQKRSKLEVVADEIGPSYKWGASNDVSSSAPKPKASVPHPEVKDDDLF
jgi:single-strand DNA-binding protein